MIDLLQGDNNAFLTNASYVNDPEMGRSLNLNGGFMTIPYADVVSLTDNFSLEITFKTPSLQYYKSLVSSYVSDTDGLLIDIGPREKDNEHAVRIIAGSEIPGFSWSSNAVIEPNKVTTIKFVVKSSEGKAQLYINGQLDSERDITQPLVNSGHDIFIGARSAAGNEAYTAAISKVEIIDLNSTLYYVEADKSAVNGTFSLTPDQVAQEGDTVTVTPIPESGYRLKPGTLGYLKEGDVQATPIDETSMQFMMPAGPVTVTGEFEKHDGEYKVTVDQSVANGEITAEPAGAKQGETVTVKVRPDAGYAYVDGSLAATTAGGTVETTATGNENEFTFEMPGADVTLSAEFSAMTYDITIPAFENGSVTADKTQATVEDTVTLTVEPAPGYQLRAGSLRANGAAVEKTFRMPPADVTISAVFEPEGTPAGTFDIAVGAVTGGTVTPDKAQAGGGETVNLDIRVDAGYRMTESSIKVNGNAISGPSFIMPDEPVEITADFEAIPYKVSVAATENGTVMADKTTATVGQKVQLTVEPAQGYQLTAGSLKANGEPVNGDAFAMPAEDVTITAQFEAVRYAVNIGQTENGRVSTNKAMAQENEQVVVTVTPDPGYRLAEGSLKADGQAVRNGTFTMPGHAVTVTAVFERIPPTVYSVREEHRNQTYTRGQAAGLTFHIDAPLENHARASINGNELRKGKDYDVKGGSTVVTVAPSYLDALAEGTYTFTAHFTDGYASTSFRVVKEGATVPGGDGGTAAPGDPTAPKGGGTQQGTGVKTGDETNVTLWIVIVAAAATAIGIALYFHRRQGRKKEQ